MSAGGAAFVQVHWKESGHLDNGPLLPVGQRLCTNDFHKTFKVFHSVQLVRLRIQNRFSPI